MAKKPENNFLLRAYPIGIGSIWFGRPWPPENINYRMPEMAEVVDYLDQATEWARKKKKKIMLDTAPAYGLSEQRIGNYFRLRPNHRNDFILGTKWGAEYDMSTGESSLHHTKQHLTESTWRSFQCMGNYEMLYLHGTNMDVLGNTGIIDAMSRMRTDSIHGIRWIGTSISQEGTLEEAIQNRCLDWVDSVQLPGRVFLDRPDLMKILRYEGKFIVANSPIKKDGRNRKPDDIYKELLSHIECNIILTGTRHHLEDTLGMTIKLGPTKDVEDGDQ